MLTPISLKALVKTLKYINPLRAEWNYTVFSYSGNAYWVDQLFIRRIYDMFTPCSG